MPVQRSKLPLPNTDFSETKLENLNWIWCVCLSVAGGPHVLMEKKQMQLLLARSTDAEIPLLLIFRFFFYQWIDNAFETNERKQKKSGRSSSNKR